MRKLMLAMAGVAAAVSLVGAGAAVAADTPKPSLIDAVAAKLGVTPDQLQAAFKAALVERIDRAVADKRLTPEQAAKLKERIAQGQGLGLGARKAFGERAGKLRQRLIERGKQLGPAAAYLGFASNAALRAELAKGTSLAKIAEAKGKTTAGLVQAMTEPAKKRLAEAVAAKKLTQERAGAILKRLTEHVTRLISKSFPAKRA